MRYGIVKAAAVVRAWADARYRWLMLIFMGVELALLATLVVIEIVK
jgi:hypothetical protein